MDVRDYQIGDRLCRGGGVMRIVLLIAIPFILGACGILSEPEEKETRAALESRSLVALQECHAKYASGAPAVAVARAQCNNAATNITRPSFSFPDLLDVYLANRLAIAERYQKGQLTLAKANEELAERRSQLIAEEQRRLLASRSAVGQEKAALNAMMADGLKTCARQANSVSCF